MDASLTPATNDSQPCILMVQRIGWWRYITCKTGMLVGTNVRSRRHLLSVIWFILMLWVSSIILYYYCIFLNYYLSLLQLLFIYFYYLYIILGFLISTKLSFYYYKKNLAGLYQINGIIKVCQLYTFLLYLSEKDAFLRLRITWKLVLLNKKT